MVGRAKRVGEERTKVKQGGMKVVMNYSSGHVTALTRLYSLRTNQSYTKRNKLTVLSRFRLEGERGGSAGYSTC